MQLKNGWRNLVFSSCAACQPFSLSVSFYTSLLALKLFFCPKPFNFQDLIVNSLLELLCISFKLILENLVLDQDNNFYLISISILISCWLENVCLLEGEVTS